MRRPYADGEAPRECIAASRAWVACPEADAGCLPFSCTSASDLSAFRVSRTGAHLLSLPMLDAGRCHGTAHAAAADASPVPPRRPQPQAIRGRCSVLGAWGPRDVRDVVPVRPDPVAEISADTAVDHGSVHRHPPRVRRLRLDAKIEKSLPRPSCAWSAKARGRPTAVPGDTVRPQRTAMVRSHPKPRNGA